MIATAAGFRLAARFDEVGFSDIVNMRNRVMELRAQGASVYQFEGGEPFRPTPDYIKEAMVAALKENKTRYAPSSGIPELRQAIADKATHAQQYSREVENVLVVIGGMQGLFGAFQSVVNPGDEVLVFSPFWTPIKDLVAHCQGRIVLVPTQKREQTGSPPPWRATRTTNTRAIYFNTPTNPSGVVFTRAEAEAVARFAIDRDLVVIADEAYEDIVYDGEHVSIASLDGMFAATITTFTLSKSYAMTGWRIGYAVAAEPWMTGLRKALLYSSNGVSTPTQWAALAAFTTRHRFFGNFARRLSRAARLVSGRTE